MPGMSSFSPFKPTPLSRHSALCRDWCMWTWGWGPQLLPSTEFDNWEVGVRDEDEGWMVRSGDSTSLPGRLLQRGNSLYQGPEFFSGGSFHMAPSLGVSVFSTHLRTCFLLVVSKHCPHHYKPSLLKLSLIFHWNAPIIFCFVVVVFGCIGRTDHQKSPLDHWTTRRVPECINYPFAGTQDGTAVVLQCVIWNLSLCVLFFLF